MTRGEQAQVRALRALLKGKIPVPDRECTWLTRHRPSVALVLCIGSGPWIFARRKQAQTAALTMLGDRDIADLTLPELDEMYPLDWQKRLLKAAWDYSNSFEENPYWDVQGRRPPRHRYLKLASMFGLSKTPKVLGMYARDYLLADAFPIDRHVRKMLKEHGLPTTEPEMLDIFLLAGLSPREYARALFLSKSSNPVFPATKTRRK